MSLTLEQKEEKILLVEDNAINRKIILAHIESLDVVADIAVNGREAVNRCAETKYALILMDVQMPVMNGIDATANIRSSGLNMETPIIALTANALDKDLEEYRAGGMNDCVTKPVDSNLLNPLGDTAASNAESNIFSFAVLVTPTSAIDETIIYLLLKLTI